MAISFVGATSSQNGVSPVPLTLPTSSAGNLGLIFFSRGQAVTLPTPSGWSLLGSVSSSSLTTAVFYKILEPSDSGASMSLVEEGSPGGIAIAVAAAYAGVDETTPIEASHSHGDASTISSHITDSITVLTDGAWVLDHFADKKTSSDTQSWNVPGSRTKRKDEYKAGSSWQTAMLADTSAGVSPGATAGVTYNDNSVAAQATVWSLALKPGIVVPPIPGNSRYQLQNGGLSPIVGYRLVSGTLQ